MTMDLKLILGISTTMLLARLKQSVVAGVGVTFSIMMYIALSGFMNGLNELLDGLILNRTPHIRLYNEIEPSEDQPLDLAPDFADRTVFISRSSKSIAPALARRAWYSA